MRQARDRWALTFAAILLLPLLLGTTYKWVDPQGQVHFSDSPPPAGTAYEVVATPPPPPANQSPRPPQPRRQVRPATTRAVSTRCSSSKCWPATGMFTSRDPATTGPI
ncbi:MAG: DUF4124 domain-containing protein [Proteobacteria bacterium]|nr:DUF4124 domain-containing protein [Pseudomonadota bacterium]